MASKAHIMTLGISKNKISRIVGTSLASKKKQESYLIFCYRNETCRDSVW